MTIFNSISYFVFFNPSIPKGVFAMTTPSNMFADLFTMQMNFMKSMTNPPATGPFANMMNAMNAMGTMNPASAMNPMMTMNPFMAMGGMSGGSNGAGSHTTESAANQIFGLYDSWRTMYNTWASAMGKMPNPMQGMMNAFPNASASDAFGNMSTMANTYFRLFEFWTPMLKAMQESGWSEEKFRTMFDPEQYSRIMNSVFNYVSPETMQSFSSQVSKMMAAMNDSSQAATVDMSEMMQQSMQAMSQLASGNIDDATKTYVDMVNRVQKPFAPIAKMVFIGKDREAMELTNELLKAYSVFTAQYGKIQQLTAAAGQQSMQELTTKVAGLAQKGEQPKTYDEFFKMWVKSNEIGFDNLFKTEEYSRLQGDMQTSSMLIRKHADALMELSMSDMPVATRSALDEAYQSIHELKRKVRSLERKVEAQESAIAELGGGKPASNKAAAAPKAAIKTTAAPKAATASKATAAKKK
jgi:polyhydroxyalkanoate synthase subunit PhaE